MCVDPIDPIDDKPQKSRFKSMKCVSKNQTIMEFKYCRVKVFSWNSSGLAINMTYNMKLGKPIYVRMNIYYKYGTIYRRVFGVPEVEMCWILKNLKSKLVPPFVKAFIDVLGKSVARFLDGCPYFGEVNVLAQFDDSKWPSIFPTGMYKMENIFRLPDMPVFMLFNLEFEMVSPIKTSF